MIALAAGSSGSASVWAQPGTLGFIVVFGMAVVLYFVFKSMSRHLRKVNEAARAQAAADEAAQGRADATASQPDASVASFRPGNGSRPAS